MFTIDQTMTAQKLREKELTRAFFSMNNHQVATPEMMLEEARSYILFFREPGGRVSAYIGLHLLQTDRKLIYACSSNQFSESEYDVVREEALGFVEGLGAMLDEVDFSDKPSAERGAWFDSQEMFVHKPEVSKPETPAEEPPQPQAIATQPDEPAVPAAAPEERLAGVRHETNIPPGGTPAPSPQPPAGAAPQPQSNQSHPAPPAAQPYRQPVYAPATQPAQSAPPVQQPVQSIWPESPERPIAQQPAASPEQPAPPPAQQVSSTEITPEVVIEEQPAPRPAAAHAAPSSPRIARKSPEKAPAATAARENRPIVEEPVSPPHAPEADADGIMHQAIKAGIVKPPKTPLIKDIKTAAGVVSRDREALARLLTSF